MLNRLFSKKADVPAVTVEQAQHRQLSGALIVDVREPKEWSTGHAPEALHIPLGELARRVGELPMDRELLTICARGHRSAQAAEILRQAGYSQVANVDGGMVGWAKRGLPVVRG